MNVTVQMMPNFYTFLIVMIYLCCCIVGIAGLVGWLVGEEGWFGWLVMVVVVCVCCFVFVFLLWFGSGFFVCFNFFQLFFWLVDWLVVFVHLLDCPCSLL